MAGVGVGMLRGRGVPFIEKCFGFLVSWFLGVLVYWFIVLLACVLLVPSVFFFKSGVFVWFLCFLVPKLQSFKDLKKDI